MYGGKFVHFAWAAVVAYGLPEIWYHSPGVIGLEPTSCSAWSRIACCCPLRTGADLMIRAVVLAVVVAVALGEASALLLGEALSLEVAEPLGYVESVGGVESSGVGLCDGSALVSL